MSEPIVIARGFLGEPHRLLVIGAEQGRVTVANPRALKEVHEDDAATLCLPFSSVFEFDAEAFDALTEEFRSRGKTDSKSWRALSPWAPR